MRIGIDVTAAIEEHAGIGRLTRELVTALVRTEASHQYVLLGPRGAQFPENLVGAPSVSTARLPLPSRLMGILWHRLRLPLAVDIWTGPLDLYHATDYTLPPHRAAAAVTVHDLSFLRHPEYVFPALRRFLEQAVPQATADAAVVLADSEHTRADLVQLLNVAPTRVRVVYGGVSAGFTPSPAEAVAAACARYALEPGRYLFTLGRIEPRKNVAGLLGAFRIMIDRGQAAGLSLAIAGSPGWLYQPIYDTVDELKLAGRVRFLGSVPDADLPPLLTGAACFAFPSFYEGFGLPPLEALACGAPVVASDASCLPEVLGEAALYAAPADAEGLAGAMALLLTDQDLRRQQQQRGLERARRFTWEAAAGQLIAAYESVGGVRTASG
ncbi:MAG: glycosyltransferase family 1 protein [Dehalococcoidia bacterium]|nr:glycosyltransferase family 1 protein [Dehalococcoidia bacterium]